MKLILRTLSPSQWTSFTFLCLSYHLIQRFCFCAYKTLSYLGVLFLFKSSIQSDSNYSILSRIEDFEPESFVALIGIVFTVDFRVQNLCKQLLLCLHFPFFLITSSLIPKLRFTLIFYRVKHNCQTKQTNLHRT